MWLATLLSLALLPAASTISTLNFSPGLIALSINISNLPSASVLPSPIFKPFLSLIINAALISSDMPAMRVLTILAPPSPRLTKDSFRYLPMVTLSFPLPALITTPFSTNPPIAKVSLPLPRSILAQSLTQLFTFT